jgi:hypothetical protein
MEEVCCIPETSAHYFQDTASKEHAAIAQLTMETLTCGRMPIVEAVKGITLTVAALLA